MNTVMDDNKMLTLASNERIPLTPTMRLLLEINHMNHCSPATVSRGGVIFVNAEDVGWKPVVDSWIEKLEVRGCGGTPGQPRDVGFGSHAPPADCVHNPALFRHHQLGWLAATDRAACAAASHHAGC